MPVAFWCILAGVFLPYVWSGLGVAFRKKEFGKVDAHHPRIQQAQATGIASRATAAERNAWEALSMFAPAVIAAHLFAPTSTLAPTLAMAWVGVRVLHGAFYLANIPPLRTLSFVGGMVCSALLFLIAGKVM
jgi:uncharacterized MAPEG superfamily protein